MSNNFIFKRYFDFKTINNSISGVQKALTLYDKLIPIIKNTMPVVNNIKSTLSVVRAFRKINNNDLSFSFDSLPDYNKDQKNTQKSNAINDKEVENPFYRSLSSTKSPS